MKFECGCKADVGQRKSINQDKLLVNFVNTQKGRETALFAVADGMGGTEGGEEAGNMAIEKLKQWHESADIDHLLKGGNGKAILNSLNKCFIIINEIIINYGNTHGMTLGTTLSAILIIDRNFYIAHTGDSRIYLKTLFKTTQMTYDHSLVADQVRRGLLKPKDAEKDSRRNVLTHCLGIKEETKVFTKEGKLKNNDIIILCSDGLYKYVKPQTIGIKGEDLQNLADELIAKANEMGGSDNISVIIARVKDEKSFLSKIRLFRK